MLFSKFFRDLGFIHLGNRHFMDSFIPVEAPNGSLLKEFHNDLIFLPVYWAESVLPCPCWSWLSWPHFCSRSQDFYQSRGLYSSRSSCVTPDSCSTQCSCSWSRCCFPGQSWTAGTESWSCGPSWLQDIDNDL